MTIENKEELLAEIELILPSIQQKMKNDPNASVYVDFFQRLHKIKSFTEASDFSVKSKQSCDLSGPIVALYPEPGSLNRLGESLSEINNFYQNENIQTLDKEQAEQFFLNRPI